MANDDASVESETPLGAESAAQRLWNRRVDIVIVVLLGLGSVLATWAGYQASQWSGLKADSAVLVEDLQQAADRSTVLGYQDRQLDVSIFMAWVEAHLRNDTRVTAFYEHRFTTQFRPAFDAWMATDPFNNPDAPLDPFRMPEYIVPALQAADTFNQQANDVAEAGEEFKVHADAYVFLTVLVAIVLFIGGVATKVATHRGQLALIVLAWVILGYCIVQAGLLPKAGTAMPLTAEVKVLQAAQQATPVR